MLLAFVGLPLSRPLAAQTSRFDLLGAHAQILTEARTLSPALRSTRAKLAAARATARAAGLGPVTSLGADLSDGLDGNVVTGNLTVTASREMFGGERRLAARELANVEVAAALRELEAHERALSLEVVRDLAAAVSATRILRRLEAGDSWLEATESALQSRLATGDARYLDVLRVRTERLQLAADRADAVADRRAGIAALAARVEDGAAASAITSLVDSAARDDAVEHWLALIGERPPTDSLLMWSDALRQARADQERAAAQRKLQQAELRRQWNGVAGVQRIGPDNGGPSMGIVLGMSTTLPFTARRGFTALQEAADAGLMSASVEREAAERQAAAALDAGIARDEAAQERLRLLSAALGSVTQIERDAALTHYRNGEISFLELLDFERALLRVEVERARALAAAATARAALFGLEQLGPDQ